MKNIVFTLCSNNYLAHAKTLGDSVRNTNPDFHFIIGLVDKRDPKIDYSFFKDFEIIDYDAIGFPVFEEMVPRYNVIEFNTAVKPFYFEYLFGKYGVHAKVFYIDPDIVVFSELKSLVNDLDEANIILTPNLTEAPNKVDMGELASLRHGMYNLGFIGIRNGDESYRFVKWWQNRLRNHCVIDKPKGLFVDQKWVDLAPLFFKGVGINFNKGCNMAWWNLNERKLMQHNRKYFVNDLNCDLVFFHFSGYVPGSKNYTGRINNTPKYSLSNHPELLEIFNDYAKALFLNNYQTYSKLHPLLNFAPLKAVRKSNFGRRIKSKLKSLLT